MSETEIGYLAFVGHRLLARGDLAEVIEAARLEMQRGCHERLALFDEQSGAPFDVDLNGSREQVLARLAGRPDLLPPTPAPPKRRGPGRPRLGVVCREVSLLPRHWEWLKAQPRSASATLRLLIDAERKLSAPRDRLRKAIDQAYGFMSDMAGDLPGFEEASRALFGKNLDGFRERISGWPEDLRAQLERFLARAT